MLAQDAQDLRTALPRHMAGGGAMPLLAAAEMQDHLMVASNDLERLQRLLDDASGVLLGHFARANDQLAGAPQVALDATQHADQHADRHAAGQARLEIAGAITALQFQDMASQLISHTLRRLRNCADRIARDTMGDDDEDGIAVVEELPLRPNPVTQDEMDAGSVELF